MEIDHKKIEALGDLYDKTGVDWELRLSHCLTEPTCPTATVVPEGKEPTRYRVDADTIEDAINGAVDKAYRELILGEKITPFMPFTNPDDKELEAILGSPKRDSENG